MVSENRYYLNVDYRSRARHGRPPLSEPETLEANCIERAWHLHGIFFLLRHLNLSSPDEPDDTDIEMAMQSIGRLGECINNGFFTDIDELAKLTKINITGHDLYNAIMGSAEQEPVSANKEGENNEII